MKIQKIIPLFWIIFAILAIVIGRTILAKTVELPRLFEIFEIITFTGCLAILPQGRHFLKRGDWGMALFLGAIVGVGMLFATLFTPYPYIGWVYSRIGQALIRGILTCIAALGGLAVMRQDGPVQFRLATAAWRKFRRSLLIGLMIGMPLAILNIFALQISSGNPILWQNPFAALIDAFQPAILEEIVYRFAFLGLLWLALRKSLPNRAGWISGLLALLVHNFAHFSDLFIEAPLVALGMGLAMAIIWGLPPTILALRRDIDSAIAFHWIQDVARFLAGF